MHQKSVHQNACDGHSPPLAGITLRGVSPPVQRKDAEREAAGRPSPGRLRELGGRPERDTLRAVALGRGARGAFPDPGRTSGYRTALG